MNHSLSLVYISAALTAVTLASAACTAEMPAYSRFRAIPPEGWSPDEGVIFTPFPSDSVTGIPYRMHLCLRHRLPAQPEAVLVVESEGLFLPEQRDTVTLTLLDRREDPIGHGAYSIYEIETPLALIHPPFPEEYSVMVSPADTLVSVTEIGIFLTRE